MNLQVYKQIYASALEHFMKSVFQTNQNISGCVSVLYDSNTYVFRFGIQREKQMDHIHNQTVLIGHEQYSVHHVFMKEDTIFCLYSFCCSCPYGLIEGHLQSAYAGQISTYDYNEHFQKMQHYMASSDQLSMDFLTDDPQSFPFQMVIEEENVSKRRKRIPSDDA